MPSTVSVDFRAFFERSPGLHLVLDPQLFILAGSDNYFGAVAKRREDIVGQHFFDAFSDDPIPADTTSARNLRGSLERAVRERISDAVAMQKYFIRQAGGRLEERYWRFVNTPILDSNGHLRYVIQSIEDLTESAGPTAAKVEVSINQQIKVANEELAARTAQLNDALETMETFTYSIAHDLRAPLRALVTFSTLV